MSGPCTPWTSGEEVLDSECCTVIDGTDPAVIDWAAEAATELLFVLSGGIYSGECEALVRPCSEQHACAGPWNRWDNSPRRGCGCYPLDRVPLAGHAREVLEVTIDGEVVDPATYQLDEGMWLTRINDPADPLEPLYWPRCEDPRRALTEEGTFGVHYTYGHDPSPLAVLAANELTCAVYQTCTSSDPGACPLPSGVTQIVRQGVTINLNGFSSWGLTDGKWQTGLALTDAFLNAVNPSGGRKAKAQVWSPDLWKYPRPVALPGS